MAKTQAAPVAITWAASGVLTAGAADVFQTSTVIDNSAGYGAEVMVKLTNGATGPTLPAQVFLEFSGDGSTNWAKAVEPAVVGDTANNAVVTRCFFVPHWARFWRLGAGRNTGQNVTITTTEYSAISAL